MRCALYARYSSNHQSEASIDDQVRLCRAFAEARGWTVVESFTDHAISGAATVNRPGLLALMAAAKAGGFEIVVAEALDRLSRDQADIATLHKRLRHHDVAIWTPAEGEVNELHIGLKGTMNALFLKDLADKIRRGQRGRIAVGRCPGGLSYGYDVVRELDAAGELVRGKRRINPGEAAIVQRIFKEYVGGLSPRAIAAGLNWDGVPAARGGAWSTSAINGNRGRANGILNNEAYIGFLVWNRTSFRKDPDTGKRLSRLNPREDWVVAEMPGWRIVEDAVWDRVQARKDRYANLRVDHHRRPKRLLSGLIECGICGGGYTVKDKLRLACATHREKGTCDNGATVLIDRLEQRVLEGLKERLLAPDVVRAFVSEYRQALAERRTAQRRDRAAQDRQAADIERKIARIVTAIEDGSAGPALIARLATLEDQKAAIEARRTPFAEPGIVELHPNLPALYARKVEALRECLNKDDVSRTEAIGILRSLIDKIVITPAGRGDPTIELHGQLAALIALADDAPPADPAVGLMAVAEEGLEPPTRGL